MKTRQQKDNEAIYKYELIRKIVAKNPMHVSSYPDEAKLTDKVYKQLDRLSIDVLEYLNNCKG